MVHRASPTDPIVVTCPSWTLNARWPKTSLVEKSTMRSSVSIVATPASRTLYVPMTFTRIVRTGLSRTVSTPAMLAQWTMCVAPRTSFTSLEIEHVRLDEGEVRMLGELGARERVPVRLSSATISSASTSRRASVVAMKPAPPVMTTRLSRSGTRRV